MRSDSPTPPRLIVSRDGDVVNDFTFNDKKVLIGRSDFADIVIEDLFASKLHAIVLVYTDALVLLDLNSANGLAVNSVIRRSAVLEENDIISIGNHRLKVENAPEVSEKMRQMVETKDTLKMMSISDVKRLKETQRKLIALQNKNTY